VCSRTYPACNAHVPYCRLWPVRLYYVLSTLSHRLHGFGKRLLKIKCMFSFSLQRLSETLILGRFEQDMIIIHVCLNVKYPLFLSDFNET